MLFDHRLFCRFLRGRRLLHRQVVVQCLGARLPRRQVDGPRLLLQKQRNHVLAVRADHVVLPIPSLRLRIESVLASCFHYHGLLYACLLFHESAHVADGGLARAQLE